MREGVQIRVRPAEEADASAAAALHVRAWQAAYRGQIPDAVLDALETSGRERVWREIVQRQRHGAEVATLAEVLVGFCELVPSRDVGAPGDVAEISMIYVDPAHWGLGAGRALLESSSERALRLGYRALTLWVLATNTSAQQFYQRLGFAPDGASKTLERPTYFMHEVRYRRPLT